MSRDPLTPVEAAIRRRRRCVWLVLALLLGGLIYWLVAVNQYVIAHEAEEEHFLHGSIGAETANGLPVWAFRALPVIYADRMGGEGWRHFGLIYEQEDDPLPIGFSSRVVTGVERVWFNCSLCHVGTYRLPGQAEQQRIPGAPSNNLRLHELIAFLIRVGRDPGFTPDRLMEGIAGAGGDLSWPERLVYRHIVHPRLRDALAWVGERLDFIHRQQDWGPGRVDTFNPYKAIQFNFPMDEAHLAAAALDGASDYPAIWQQRPREGMNLHWDGNNDSVAERNLSAALGAGVTPVTVDRPAIARIERWMRDLPAPRWPGPVEGLRAAEGAGLYAAHCASCHGMGRDARAVLRDFPPPAGVTAAEKARVLAAAEAAWPSSCRPQGEGNPIPVFPEEAAYRTDAPVEGAARPSAPTGLADQATAPMDEPAPATYSRPASLPGAEGVAYDYDRGRYPCLGEVVALSAIGTDPGRWASYTREFAAAQNLLYAGKPWRFHRFRKTQGYASQPLDGIWARSPYLHNGSVPTLRDLMEPPALRPRLWQRGSDELDLARVGYRSDAAAPGRLFPYDTTRPGNSNAGHEYGTRLTPAQKDALVEYMKTL